MADRRFVSIRGSMQPLLRLICIPYAGAGIAAFRKWEEQLPSPVQLCAVHLPGRDSQIDLPPFTRLEPLIDVLVEGLSDLIDLPFALFGHSMGGLIAFELAQALHRQSVSNLVHLLVSGSRAPQITDRQTAFCQLPEAEFIEVLRQRYGAPGISLEDDEFRRMFLKLIRADFELVETYRYKGGETFDVPITAYGGTEDSTIRLVPDILSWEVHTRCRFSYHMLSGGHFFINTSRPSFLSALTQTLNAHL